MIKFNAKSLAAGAAVLLAVMGVGSHLMVNHLESELQAQCQAQDWPAETHDLHVDFCHASGYPVK